MKNFRYLLVMLIAFTATVSCVEDEFVEKDLPPVVGSVLKLNEIMSKDVNDNPDWIEVYNSGDEDFDISGYILNDKDVAAGGYEIPAGTVIAAKGFYVVDEDTSGIKVSSGGEDVSLSEPDETVVDFTRTPDMTADVGLTWAREIDGEGDWKVSSPTPGTSNGKAANTPPILSAEPLTEFMDVYEVTASDADGIASVKLIHMINNGVQSIDMALVDGKYKTSVPKGKVGDVVKYYVVATDNSGLVSYYPESAPEELGLYYTTGGSPLFIDIVIEGVVPGYTEDLVFNVNVVDANGIEEVKLYYILPGQVADDKEKIEVTEPNENGIYKLTVPAADINGEQIRYYLRAESVIGEKTYYPSEEDGTFDHDDETTWPIVYEPVVDKVISPTQGPLTKLTFAENPLPGNNPVVLEYSIAEEITEARIYFDVGDAPTYDTSDKIKGEKLDSFTQTGVTMNFEGLSSDNGDASIGGAKVSFYVRISTATNEYYYSNDGTMYIDETPGGGTKDESDDFKANPAIWNTFIVQ